MRSLQALCEDSAFTTLQRKVVAERITKLLETGGSKKDVALHCLRELWHHYDSGGHSMGRSLRSYVLEKVQHWIAEDREDEAKCGLSILIAMYFDYEYINKNDWYDYELKDITDTSAHDRAYLCAAAIAIGLEDIPLMLDWENDKIIALISNS